MTSSLPKSKKKEKYITYPAETTVFKWAGPEGFGEFIFIPSQNKIELDDEYMTKQFIKDRLCEMVDRCVSRSDKGWKP